MDHSGDTFIEGATGDESLGIVMNHLRPLDMSAVLDWLKATAGDQRWGLSSVSKPAPMMAEKIDQTAGYTSTVRPIYDNLTSPNTLWTSDAAGQQAFSDLCRSYDC